MKKLTLMLLCSILLLACNGENEAHEAHGMEPLAYTIYTEKSELFVEFEPMIVGKNTKFLAHFTLLGEKFLPLTEGSVTVSLIMNDKGIRQTADSASSPGIYRLALEPKVAGTGDLIFEINHPAYADKIVVENVKVYPNEEAAATDQIIAPENEITYLKEQAWKVEFANMEVKKQTFYDITKTSGQILAAPGDEVIVSAKSSGIVIFTGTNSIVGSAVSKGSSLFIISGEGLTEGNINAKFKEAKSNFEKATADYERAKELIDDKIISQKEFLEIQNRYETTESNYNSLAQNYTGRGTKITAPISGFLKNLYVSEGQFVQIGDPIASVSQNKKIVLHADVSQNYYSKLAAIHSANFVTLDHHVYNTADLNGRVLAYGKSTNDQNPFIPITFEIDNLGEILPGSFVEIYLKSNPIPDALVIPLSALLEEQGHYYVYVQLGGENFTKREVKLGSNDGINVQVLSGIEEGERIVTKGAYNIKLSVASGTLPAHGHEH